MTIRLLAFDLDGTLLDSQSQLSLEVIDAVARARRAEVEVILVTGRAWRATRDIYQALSLTTPAICYLGALIVADGTGRVVHHCPLVKDAWDAVRHVAVSEGLSVTACVAADLAVVEGELPNTDLVAADTAIATCSAPDFRDWDGWNLYTEIAPDLAGCTSQPTMVAVYGDRAVRRLLQAFPHGLPQSQFDLTDRILGETVLHIWHESVDKGRALAEICRQRGVLPEEVAAIGDAPMDCSMIEFAGLGVAVPHAHLALKAKADLVATPVELIDLVLRP